MLLVTFARERNSINIKIDEEQEQREECSFKTFNSITSYSRLEKLKKLISNKHH